MLMFEKHKLEKGAIFMSLSGLSASLFALFIKLGIETTYVTLLVTFRFIFPFLLILPFVFFYKAFKLGEFWKEIRKQALRGVTVVVGQYCFFYYLTQGSLLNATVILNVSTVFIVILSRYFFRHHVSKITWITTVAAFVGVLLVLKPDKGIFDLYSFLGLFSAFCLALSQIIFGIHSEEEGRVVKNIFYFLLIPSVLTSIVAAFEFFFHTANIQETETLLVGVNLFFLFGIAISSLFNQMLRGVAYSYSKPSILAPFLYIAVIFSAFLDWFLFNHIPDIITILGVVVILISSLLQLVLNKN